MFARHCAQGVLLLSIGSILIGCSNSGLDSIQVTPATQSLTVGQTTQFTAVGTYGNATRPSTHSLTSGVNWTSSTPSVATINASGLATGVGTGTTTITAAAPGFNGSASSSATLTVTGSGSGASGGTLLSLAVVPTSITVGNLQDTGQFLAIGTFSVAPTVRDLTNSPMLTWISSVPSVFPVNNTTAGTAGAPAGIVTAYGNGSGSIIAEATSSDGTIQTATATFSCPLVLPNPPTTPGSCFVGSQAPALLATLTIYNEGLNTTDWEVTAASATGTPDVVHCGPGWALNGGAGGSVCTATYPFTNPPTTVILKAAGGAFGGWSYNCIPSNASGVPLNPATITAVGPNYCTVTFDSTSPTLNTNVTVGAIFN